MKMMVMAGKMMEAMMIDDDEDEEKVFNKFLGHSSAQIKLACNLYFVPKKC